MSVHRRMPVVTAVERGCELPWRRDISIAVEHVADLVWIFLVHACQCEFGETIGGFRVKFGSAGYGRPESQQQDRDGEAHETR